MAYIKCFECGTVISANFNFCSNCGSPIFEKLSKYTVEVQFPEIDIEHNMALFLDLNVKIFDFSNETLWSGNLGENARFRILEPTRVMISIAKNIKIIICELEPNKKYILVEDTEPEKSNVKSFKIIERN